MFLLDSMVFVSIFFISLNIIHILFEYKDNLTKFSCDQFGFLEPIWLKYIVIGVPFLTISGPIVASLFLSQFAPILWSIAAGGFIGDLLFTHIGGSVLLKNKVPGTNWYTYIAYPICGVGILWAFGFIALSTALIGFIPFLVYWPGFYIVKKIKNHLTK